jgi:ribosomal protein L29
MIKKKEKNDQKKDNSIEIFNSMSVDELRHNIHSERKELVLLSLKKIEENEKKDTSVFKKKKKLIARMLFAFSIKRKSIVVGIK